MPRKNQGSVVRNAEKAPSAPSDDSPQSTLIIGVFVNDPNHVGFASYVPHATARLDPMTSPTVELMYVGDHRESGSNFVATVERKLPGMMKSLDRSTKADASAKRAVQRGFDDANVALSLEWYKLTRRLPCLVLINSRRLDDKHSIALDTVNFRDDRSCVALTQILATHLAGELVLAMSEDFKDADGSKVCICSVLTPQIQKDVDALGSAQALKKPTFKYHRGKRVLFVNGESHELTPIRGAVLEVLIRLGGVTQKRKVINWGSIEKESVPPAIRWLQTEFPTLIISSARGYRVDPERTSLIP